LILSSGAQASSAARIRIVDAGETPPAPPGPEEVPVAEVPAAFSLSQNTPNPFNPTTVIGFSLPDRGRVTLVVYDVLGRAAATLVDGELDGGEHEVRWDAAGMPSGVYLYRLASGGNSAVKKLLLVR
jgi:hypothetical protein